MMINGDQEVQDAFMRTYDLDLRKFGGGGIANSASRMEVVKIS
jgi:hypothetical protein